MKLFHILTLVLLLIGGVNWALVGLVDLNLFTTFFGTGVITTVIYLIVAFSTLYHILPMLTNKLTTD